MGTRRYVIEARCARHERPFFGQHQSDVCGRNYPGLFLAGALRSLGRFITETNKHVSGCHLPVCFTCFFIHPPQHLFMQKFFLLTLGVSFMQFLRVFSQVSELPRNKKSSSFYFFCSDFQKGSAKAHSFLVSALCDVYDSIIVPLFVLF